jgi:branched-chain amino acid transport system permease protein
VVVGGANVLLGTAPAAMLLALVRMALNASYGQIIGQIGMLFAVIAIIRILPEGLSSILARRGR